MKNKIKTSISLCLLCLLSNQAKADINYEVPLIDSSLIFKKYNIDYSDIKTIIYKKDKERKISILTKYLVKKYKLKNPYIEEIISTMYHESENAGIDPILFLSLIEVESKFNQFAKSRVGAIGLTQIMPQYHQSKIINVKNNHDLDIWSIKGNIKIGVHILKEYIALSKGNLEEALQRYNGSLNDKNKRYSKKIFFHFEEFTSLFS